MTIRRILWFSAILILITAGNVTGQESSGIGTGGFSPFNTENAVPRAETSAEVVSWDPNTGHGLIGVRYVYPEDYHQIDDPDFFTAIPDPLPGAVFGTPMKARPVISDGLPQYYDETTVILEFQASPEVRILNFRINALFQICDEAGTCLFPDSRLHEFDFDTSAAGFDPPGYVEDIISWNENPGTAVTGAAVPAPPVTRVGSLWLFLLMALAGGILLNVMPCVLPLLSVKALGLVKQAGAERRDILKHSWLYVAGIEVSFWVLAAIVIVLQTSGKLLGWGFQFQSPGFVLILIAVIWIFALSMFDVFVIEAPKSSMRGAAAAGSRGGYLGSFLTGVFAVLVATPCTAPFLGAALGFAFSQPPAVIIAVFSVTGIGLGLPFLLLGFWPAIIQRLPKPGDWMNTFKEVMGFLLLGTAVYLFTTFIRLAPTAANGALWWFLVIGFAAWLLGRSRQPLSPRWFRIAGQVSALIIVVAAGFAFIDLPDGSSAETAGAAVYNTKNNAVDFDESEVEELILSGQPVFLEFTAAWCTTCKINQRVINDAAVQNLMTERGVTHIRGDLTAYNETLTRWLADFGRAGVPLYVLYPGNGADPIVLPEIITVDGLVQSLEKAGT